MMQRYKHGCQVYFNGYVSNLCQFPPAVYGVNTPYPNPPCSAAGSPATDEIDEKKLDQISVLTPVHSSARPRCATARFRFAVASKRSEGARNGRMIARRPTNRERIK